MIDRVFSVCTLAVMLLLPRTCGAQERYELYVPNSTTRSTAVVTPTSLQITTRGAISTYSRDRQYDAAGYQAYSNSRLMQVIRWPIGGGDAMQIGAMSRLGVSYRQSQMRIRALGGVPAKRGGSRTTGANSKSASTTRTYYRLTNDFLGASRSLNANRRGTLTMAASAASAGQYWQVISLGNRRYRLTNSQLGPGWSLTANLTAGDSSMTPTDAKSNDQIWKITPAGGKRYRLIYESAGGEWALDNDGGGDHHPTLVRRGDTTGQIWTLTKVDLSTEKKLAGVWTGFFAANDRPSGRQITIAEDFTFVQSDRGQAVRRGKITLVRDRLTLRYDDGDRESFRYQAVRDRVDFFHDDGLPHDFYWRASTRRPAPLPLGPRRISREVVPLPALKPARIEFANKHSSELWVLVSDLRDETASLRLKIPTGRSTTAMLDRDAGAKVVETWEVPQPTGEIKRELRETQIPAKQFYQVSVYELFVQSKSVDGTRKGGGRVESVNLAPKSVGAFPIPAGAALRDGATDVYRHARRKRNPGAVIRIDPKQWRIP